MTIITCIGMIITFAFTALFAVNLKTMLESLEYQIKREYYKCLRRGTVLMICLIISGLVTLANAFGIHDLTDLQMIISK